MRPAIFWIPFVLSLLRFKGGTKRALSQLGPQQSPPLPEPQILLPVMDCESHGAVDTDASSVHRPAQDVRATPFTAATIAATKGSNLRDKWRRMSAATAPVVVYASDDEAGPERVTAASSAEVPPHSAEVDFPVKEEIFGNAHLDSMQDDSEQHSMNGPGPDHELPLDSEEHALKKTKYTVEDAAHEPERGDPIQASSSEGSRSANPALTSLALRNMDSKVFKYPWERGRLGKFFNKEEQIRVPNLRVQPGHRSFVQVQVCLDESSRMETKLAIKPPDTEGAIFTKAVKKLVGGTYKDDRAARRAMAVRMWWTMLSTQMEHSDPGIACAAEATEGHETEYGVEVLDAIFGVKSPATLLKRFYALQSYQQWHAATSSSSWLPLQESSAWAYLKFLRSSGAAATRAASFLEAVTFGQHVLNISGCDEVTKSSRVRGLTTQIYANKKPWRPADGLSLHQVKCLHKAFQDSEANLVDRLLIGHMLHLLYSRSRWSDMLSMSNLYLDDAGVYLEGQVHIHKGARSAETKARLLPVVAVAVGVDGSPWAKQYLALRHEAGLRLPGDSPTYMMPAPCTSGEVMWAPRFLTSEEANVFIKHLFTKLDIMAPRAKYTTHSFKTTAISWCAKFGIDPNSRALLARHQTAANNPTALYSRDLLTSPLRLFSRVIEQIQLSCCLLLKGTPPRQPLLPLCLGLRSIL